MLRFRVLLVVLMLGIFGLLAGCMKGEQAIKEMDVPEDVSEAGEENTADDVNLDDKTEEVTETEETVARELYLLDESGLVVPQEMELPKSESAAKQVLEYLVKDGPVTEMLPNGFEAVLPVGTEILGVNLEEDGTLIVDVSEDFSNYESEQELQIIQAMTHTLTQFDSVNQIKLWINGENQTEMPVNNTPLSDGYSRANGINLDITEKPDVQSNGVATIYYPKSYDAGLQFVPVTKYLKADNQADVFSSIVQAMIEGPSYPFIIKDVFNDRTALLKKPFLEDGVLQLEFNEDILQDEEQQIIADEVMEMIVRTLTEQEEVDAVQVSVKDVPKLQGENGASYDEPVSMQQLKGKEKM